MKKLTELAIKRPLLILVIFTVLILFGIMSYRSLNYNLLPKFNANIISINTTYRGASADEIENNVTKKIEDGVSSLEGIDQITSSSMEGASIITIRLLNGVDVDKAISDAQRKVDAITSQLPTDVDKPVINKFSSDDIPILMMSVTSTSDSRSLYDIIDQQIKPQIANVPGVGQVTIIGGTERQILVNVNQDKLKSYGMSIGQLAQIINASSLSTPAGQVKADASEYTIKFDAKFQDVDAVRKMVVLQTSGGGKVYLSDVADVVDGAEEPTQLNHMNGKPSIGIQVQKQTDANAVNVSKLVQQRLKDLETQYKDIHLHFDIATDQSTYTLQSANAVMDDLMIAVVIVSVVMLFFLHSVRSSLFVLVALPSSMIPTFIFMYLFGMSLNLMTLMALSLVVGILVDDSIVILENIMRHMEMGKNRKTATIDGRSEIGFTAMAITLVDVVVFLPMALTSGLIGSILREFALVVVCSTLMSLFVCFTLTPLLASRFGRLVHLSKKSLWGRLNLWFEKVLDGFRDSYTSALRWFLKNKWTKLSLLGIIVVLFAITFAIFGSGLIGATFVSKGDQGQLVIKLEMAPQTSLYETNMITEKAEQIVLRQKDVVDVFSNIGYSSTGLGTTSNSNLAEINVKLTDKSKRNYSSDDFGSRMVDSISKIPGVKASVSQVDITGNAAQPDIQIAVKGPTHEVVRTVADTLKQMVAAVHGTNYVEFSTKNPKPEYDVTLDREKMAIFGVNPSDVGNAISVAFRGNDNAKYKYNGNEYDIMVEFSRFDRSSIDDLKRLTFTGANGQSFQLSQFAEVKEIIGESVLERTNRLPSITINATVIGVSNGTVGDSIRAKFAKYKFPAGVTADFIGNQKDMQDSMTSLLMALGIGILLVYFIMVALYESAIYPFVVLFALPLAMIGAFLALALTQQELSIFAMIGLIMLMGLVAKNGILLVDFTNHLKAQGRPLKEALIEAGRERFRPIMMTTIAMITGMLPMALATGSGSEVKSGMAWVIIGGLTSSLLLTLVVVPTVYYVVDICLERKLVKPFLVSLVTAAIAAFAASMYIPKLTAIIFFATWIGFYFLLKNEFKANRSVRFKRAKALYLKRLAEEREN
ncbi:acriflavin resistance protein [Arachidicoccus ginsenosidimutans]|uniref:efflux RND transporter permease subunit n=1 Tax=Arachidicoccus sp. BS20 TaxID=1850526 RepID=UPI0007F12E54|nr:efflux RND transporter permease subunit [Arachidicoccus sp. BS20]ANI87936.1 acriflavin resistance protein [Arachidicoccus sp. BS20]